MGKMSITTNIPIWVGVKLKNDTLIERFIFNNN